MSCCHLPYRPVIPTTGASGEDLQLVLPDTRNTDSQSSERDRAWLTESILVLLENMDIMKIHDGISTRTIVDQLYSSTGNRWCQTMIPSYELKEFVFQMKTTDLILILKLKEGRFLSQNSMYLANFISIAERWCSASIVGWGKSGLDAQEIVLRVTSKFRMRNFSCLFNKPQSNQAADAPRRRI